jgi:hypothetical protein
MALTITQN